MTIEKTSQIATVDGDGSVDVDGDVDVDVDVDVDGDDDDVHTRTPKETTADSKRIENTEKIAPPANKEEEKDTREKTPEELPGCRERIVAILDEKKEEEPVATITEKRCLQREVDAVIDANDVWVVVASSTTADNATKEPEQNQNITPALHKESSTSTIDTHEEEEPVTEGAADVAEEEAQRGNLVENDTLPTAADPSPTVTAATDSLSPSSSSSSSSSKQKTIIILLIEGMTCGGCVKVVNRVLNSFNVQRD